MEGKWDKGEAGDDEGRRDDSCNVWGGRVGWGHGIHLSKVQYPLQGGGEGGEGMRDGAGASIHQAYVYIYMPAQYEATNGS